VLGFTPATTGARSTELAADGVASYKASVTTTNSGTNGVMTAYQEVALAATGGVPVSVTIWAALLLRGGTATLDTVDGRIDWLDSGGAVIATTDLSDGDLAGAAMSVRSVTPPPTAVKARVVASGRVASWAVGAQLALYADALALTVP
jgi:hypothetical protein